MFLSSYDHTFIVQANDITIVNYDLTIITVINNFHKLLLCRLQYTSMAIFRCLLMVHQLYVCFREIGVA